MIRPEHVHQAAGGAGFGTALNSYVVESSLTFPGGLVEVRKYTWAVPVEDVWTLSDTYFLDISMSPRPGPARGRYLEFDQSSALLGQVFFVPPGHTLRSGCAVGKQRSMHCALAASMFEEIAGDKPRWNERALKEGLRLSCPEVEWLLLRIYREIRCGGFATETLVEGLMRAVCVELIRHFGFTPDHDRDRSGGLAPWRMRLIRERAQASEPPPTLGELAELCGLTVRHLSRTFRDETGQTVGKYVEAATVERAKALLTDTRRPVGEIAAQLGFASSTSFASALRRATGLRPSDIRRTSSLS
jgi:AraC family transcriptional regulator